MDSIKKSNTSAVGPDEIHDEFLEQLPDESVKCLLNIYNNIWTSGTFPKTWRLSIIVPISKLGKDTSNPQNYRSIALTSCLCKTIERMINSRMTWYLETNGLITNMQTGFRKMRGTVDHLILLKTFPQGRLHKKHLTAVFFLFRESLWYYLEVWYHVKPIWYRLKRKTTNVH